MRAEMIVRGVAGIQSMPPAGLGVVGPPQVGGFVADQLV
jgi:hypothetical protein